MKKLTKAEEEVMQILWKLEKALVKDVIDKLACPKPAYNTVSTVVRVLEKKGFVSHKAYGNTYEYYPLITKKEYASIHFKDFMANYFNNSFPKMAAFFAQENNLSINDLQEIIKLTEMEMKKTEEKSND